MRREICQKAADKREETAQKPEGRRQKHKNPKRDTKARSEEEAKGRECQKPESQEGQRARRAREPGERRPDERESGDRAAKRERPETSSDIEDDLP